jgi:signal transduction histidine kinase
VKRVLPPIILDLALAAVVTVLGYVVALWLDLFDGLVAWAYANQAWDVEKLLGALIIVPGALALFAFRRWYGLHCALRERAAAERQLAESARLEGVLLAARTMQHEINNQLGVTVGYAELLSQDPSLSMEQREMAQAAMHGAERASALLNRLRGLNRVDLLHIGAPDGPVLKLNYQTSGVTSARQG